MKDRIGRRTSIENPAIVIKRSIWSKFSSLLGVWSWVILLVNDLVKIVDLSKIFESDLVKSVLDGIKNVISQIGIPENAAAYVCCGLIALVVLAVLIVVAFVRSRMTTYIYGDTLVYIPDYNPRKNTRARSFVGVYQANVLPASGFFLFAWCKNIRRFIRGYRDIVISCPGSQSDGTIILRGVAKYREVVAKLNQMKISESTNVAYTKPTNSYTE